jgi:aminoglycoside N3'-acetyltransferase
LGSVQYGAIKTGIGLQTGMALLVHCSTSIAFVTAFETDFLEALDLFVLCYMSSALLF